MEKFFIILIALFAVAGCGGGNEHADSAKNTGSATPPAAYTTAKENWTKSGIKNYKFTFYQFSLYPIGGSIDITVKNGQISNATYSSSGAQVTSEVFTMLPTFDRIFSKADAAYAKNAAEINFTSNTTYGYLEHLYVDYDKNTTDEELNYTISNFSIN